LAVRVDDYDNVRHGFADELCEREVESIPFSPLRRVVTHEDSRAGRASSLRRGVGAIVGDCDHPNQLLWVVDLA
jgi:hypothetical protein